MKTKNYTFKKLIVIVVLLLTFNIGNAQNPIWTLPSNYLVLNPSGTPNSEVLPTPTGTHVYTGQQSEYAHNAAYNPVTGELLFFIVDDKVYDSEGYLINYLQNLARFAQGISEVSIVADPSNCKRYYIFCSEKEYSTLNASFKPAHAYFAILDLEKNREYYNTTRKGEFIGAENLEMITNVLTLVPSQYHLLAPVTKYGGIHFAVTPPKSDGSHLVLIQMSNDYVYTFNLNSTGLNFVNVFDPFYATHSPSQHDGKSLRRSELEIIPFGSGYRIAGGFAGGIDVYDGLFTYDVNASGNYITNTRQIYAFDQGTGKVYMKGIEFSPNGELIYVTHTTNNHYTKAISCVDISTWNTVSLTNISVAQAADFQYSQLELAEDGKIYAATSNRLASINNPNNGASSTWTNNALGLSSYNLSTMHYSSSAWSNMYLLPDQIDNQSCILGCFDACASDPAATECCVYYSSKEGSTIDGYIITDKVTWSPGATNNPFGSITGDVYFSDDLVIEPGAILTLDNMKLHFTPDARVIVKNGFIVSGGKLVLNATTLTSDDRCGECVMWPGVDVYGYPSAAQGAIPNNSPTIHNNIHGAIVIRSNSLIEHAHNGVTLAQSTSSGTNSSYSGGIISASSSTFSNNEKDVRFAQYSHPSISSFHRVSFFTDGLLNNPNLHPIYHVELIGIDNIEFEHCAFENKTPSLYQHDKQGFGIYSFNSNFKVYGDGWLFQPRFQNLHYGIVAANVFAFKSFSVDRTNFINNHTGIGAVFVPNLNVQRSNFHVYKSAAPNHTFETIGVHLINSSGYEVWENTFQEYNDPSVSGQGNTIGVLVDNSGTTDNEIYRNTFKNLRVGGQSQNINSEPYNQPPYANYVGLRWKCNIFTDDLYEADIAVASGGIAYAQGFCLNPSHPDATKSPAGNKFSHSANNAMNDIWMNSGTSDIEYSHHADVITTPIDFASLVQVNACSTSGPVYFDEQNSCPTKIVSIWGLTNDIDDLEASIDEKTSKIDAGNTQHLIDEIRKLNQDESEIHNTLINVSPYLSEEVLLEYIQSNPPAIQLSEVLAANSPLTDKVWMDVMDSNLPKGIKRQLEDLQVGVSKMNYLLNEINYDKSEYNITLNHLIAAYFRDTLINNPLDRIEALLLETKNSSVNRNKNLIDLYLTKQEYDNAQKYLNEYVTEFGHDNYAQLAEYAIEALQADSGSITKALLKDVSKKDLIETIAADESDLISSNIAKELLRATFGNNISYPVESLFGSKNKLNLNEDQHIMNDVENSSVLIFPNPASNEFYVVIDEESYALNNVSIKLYNLSGQHIKTVNSYEKSQTIPVNINELSKGIYLITVSVNELEISRQKISIK